MTHGAWTVGWDVSIFFYKMCRVVWSSRQLVVGVGAVLCLLDGPTGCCFVSGFGFVSFVPSFGDGE